MKGLLAIVLGLITLQGLLAQSTLTQASQDPAARKILDRLAEQARADFPLSLSFQYIYESLPDNQSSREDGTLVLQDEKFKLAVGESEIYCDGQTLWNHMVSLNEVYISDPEENLADDEFFLSNPAELFTFYRENFKYRLTRELTQEGKEYYEIDLFPSDLDKSYHTIKLLVGKKDHRLYSAQALGKQGENHTVILDDYRKRIPAGEATFVFDPSLYPGIEIVDTRF
jgi:hypothetical protein